MPNFIIERAARLHVKHLRSVAEVGCPTVRLSPDAYTLDPLVRAHAKALADLLEYHLDVQGGADGVAATRDFLITAAATLLGCDFDDVAGLATSPAPAEAPTPETAHPPVVELPSAPPALPVDETRPRRTA